MIVDGKAIASDILAATRTRVAALGRTPIVRAIVVAPSPATESYLRIKTSRASEAGMELEVVRVSNSATTEETIAAVLKPGSDATIVQLPLPVSIDTSAVLNSIPVELDADVLSSAARELFEKGDKNALVPPVAAATMEILLRSHITIFGKKAVVVGKGWLVGAPVATYLKRAGADVTVVTRSSGNLEEALANADIVVSGAGVPALIKPNMIKPGVALIDGGTSGLGGLVVGDLDPACTEVASLFTPVPGGVGPVAVACLFENAVTLIEHKTV